ncbi:ABC-ATPase domain-containing protein [Fusobacteria bacterium ZRK30]|nr:ABC-ATPase domain-containing protein [Fusobacteria bacterium ZRK30]
MKKLKEALNRLDGKSYGGYKEIRGRYNFLDYTLEILRVQGDPFASPSLFSVEINLLKYDYSKDYYDNPSKKVAFEDYILRKLNKLISKLGKRSGSGKSGQLNILSPKQEILKRSAVEIIDDTLIVKFYGGLPANGRRIASRGAIGMIFNEIPKISKELKITNVGLEKLEQHIKTNLKSDSIRRAIKKENLIVFIENNSKLARTSSIDDRVLTDGIPFNTPKSLEVTLHLDNGDIVTGMGVPKGITVITGGGFHGKSTLLTAIEKGVYNHITGDGREGVITDRDTVKIRAEDGRWIDGLDISNFINNLPHKKDTRNFTTANASGSTSQAANIMEALELGATTLLIDEDTTATNFMVRDRKIQELISHKKEPITPFIERIESMRAEDLSVIIVVGGLGDYFSMADRVIMLDEYKILDVTKKAKLISEKFENSNVRGVTEKFNIPFRKLDSQKTKRLFNSDRCKVKTRGLDELLIDRESIDIRNLEQYVENGQVTFTGEIIRKVFSQCGHGTFKDKLEKIQTEIDKNNLSKLLKSNSGSLVESRKYEIAGAITRLRKDIFKK